MVHASSAPQRNILHGKSSKKIQRARQDFRIDPARSHSSQLFTFVSYRIPYGTCTCLDDRVQQVTCSNGLGAPVVPVIIDIERFLRARERSAPEVESSPG